MNEQLASKLVEIIGSIQSATAQVGDFAVSQLPDIASQYIMYGRVNESIAIVIAVALFLFGIRSIRLLMVKMDEMKEAAAFLHFVSAIGGTGVGLLAFAINISSFCLVWFAPKVWLLKALAGLVK
jgi:hypothetical protein